MAWDESWEAIFQENEWGKYPPEYVIRFVARNWYRVPDRKVVHLLDLGCGPGACTWYMAREGFSVSSIDGSSTAIKRLEQRLESEGLSAECRVGDFTKTLPWPDNSFDGAIDNASIYANVYEDWRRALKETKRVLKFGGRLFSACFSTNTTPFNNRAFSNFVTESEVRSLYSEFFEITIDRHFVAYGDVKTDLFLVTAVNSRLDLHHEPSR
jgi:ubiquinone/menaquinone biosynthesis C-methylase UbiE